MNNKAVVAYTILQKANQLEGYQRIGCKGRTSKISHFICSRNQQYNTLVLSKAIIIPDLIKTIYQKTKSTNQVSITIYNNHYKLSKLLVSRYLKDAYYAVKYSTKVSRIK